MSFDYTGAPESFTVPDFVTVTASVSGAFGIPTGTVAFSGPGATGCDVVSLDGLGKASCTTTALPAGTPTITATYSGDLVYPAATSDLDHRVEAALAETSLPATMNTAPILRLPRSLRALRTEQAHASPGETPPGRRGS